MIELAGVTLNKDLHLVGLFSNPTVSYSVRELLGGTSVIQTEPRQVGARLSLVATYSTSEKMGEFDQRDIEALQAISSIGDKVTLTYYGSSYEVYILEFNTQQSDDREPLGPCKKYHGEIILQEA